VRGSLTTARVIRRWTPGSVSYDEARTGLNPRNWGASLRHARSVRRYGQRRPRYRDAPSLLLPQPEHLLLPPRAGPVSSNARSSPFSKAGSSPFSKARSSRRQELGSRLRGTLVPGPDSGARQYLRKRNSRHQSTQSSVR